MDVKNPAFFHLINILFKNHLSIPMTTSGIKNYKSKNMSYLDYLDTCSRDIHTNDLAGESLVISDNLCFDMFPINKSIFTENFHANESTINIDLTVKNGSISPDFDIKDDIIRMSNEVKIEQCVYHYIRVYLQ